MPGTTLFTTDRILPLWLKKKIACLTIVALVSQPIIVGAEAIADPQAAEQHRPKVETTQNGTPIVQITAPSAAGVSRNIYTQFNVDPQGLILNNSQTVTQTQLAGYIIGNPNLANGTAKIILNEVSGHDPSNLRGYTEVAGSRAEVIIANPNGITGNGFGFINASRAVLTTGTPVFGGNGSLEAFRVNQGQITVEGSGMDAQQTDRADLISRAVQVNAGIWGKEVNVVTGVSQVEHDSLQTTALTADNNRPQVAIDVSALGGMYANKIRLVGTEAGVGVNSQGIISATSDVTIDNAGKVTVGQTSAGGNIAITSRDQIINQNSLYAQGNTTVNAQAEFLNNGILASGQQTSIAAQHVLSNGTLGAGISNDGKVGSSGDLVVTADGTIITRGQNIAAGNLTLQGTALDLSGSQTTAGGNTTLTAMQGDIINTGGSIQTGNILTASAQGNIHNDQTDTGIQAQISGGQLKLTADNITNQNSRMTQTGTTDSIITASNTLDNTGGQIGINGANTILQAASVINNQGQIQHAGTGLLALQTTGDVTNTDGKIATNGQMAVNANTLDNTQGTFTAQKQIDIIIQNNLINQQGSLATGDALSITAQGNVINQQGDMEANKGLSVAAQIINNQNGKLVNLDAGDLKLTFGQDIQNQSGALGGNGRVTLTTQTLENQGGKITSKQDLSITASQGVDSIVTGSQADNSGSIASGGDLTLQSSGNILLAGSTSAKGNLMVTADSGVNNYGTVYGQQDTTISSTQGTLTNTGTIVAGRNTVLNGQNLQSSGILGAGITTDGSVGSNGDLTMNAAQHISTSGQNMAANNLTVTAGAIDLSGSTTYANNNVSLTATAGDIINRGGSLQAQGALILTAQNAVDNTKAADGTASKMQADEMTIKAQSISNTGSTMIQTGTRDANITATNDMNNTGGTIAANGKNLNLVADTINNSQGTIVHAGTENLNITATTGIININGGTVQTNGNANLTIGVLDNSQGRITALNNMSITGHTVANDQGMIAAGGSLNIGMQNSLSNQQGTVEAGHALTLNAQTVMNQDGSLTSLDNSGMTVDAQAIDNTSGTMGGNGDVNITAQTLTNNAGKVLSQGNLTANVSQNIDNTGGTIAAQQNVTLGSMGTTLTNASQGNIAAGNTLSAQASSLNNVDGTMAANQDVNLAAGAINNAGNLTAGQDLNLTVNGDFTSTNGNTMKANRDLHLSANKVNNAGSLSAVRSLTVDAVNVTNNAGGNIQGGEKLTVKATGIMANAGNMEGNTADISAQTIDNTGSVFGNNLTMTADTISNHDAAAVIATTQNTNLFVKSSLENKDDANMYSMGNIHIAGSKNQDAAGEYTDKTGSVLNQSATIQAGGNIGIYADTLTNKKREFETGEQVVSTNQYATGTYWDMRNSTWLRGDDRNVYNVTERGYEDVVSGVFVKSPNRGGYIIGGEGYWYLVSGYFFPGFPDPDNTGIKLSKNNNDSVWLLGETISETNILKDSPSGRIAAGKDIRLQAGQVNNDLSTISAAGSLTVSADTVNNTTVARVRSTTQYLDNVHWYWDWDEGGPGGSPRAWGYNIYRPQTVTTNESLPGYSSAFGEGQQVTIEAKTINNLEVVPSTVTSGNVKSLTSGGQTQGAATVTTGSSNHNGSIALTGTAQNLLPPAKNLPNVAPRQTTNGDQIVLPTNAMYKISQEPSAHYLVETNPRFANYKDFISSDYMLQQLGLDPDKTMKRLGDGFYEQKLVSEQVNELTGRVMLSNISSEEEQYKTLLNNGVTYAKQVNLQVGVALTSEQMANLTSDMVWLTEKEIDGQKVLVPVAYLAQVRTGDLKADGALIAADNIVLKTQGDLTNMGVIKATQKVDISADNLSNLTGLITGGQTDVTAKHTITLTGGTISAIGDVNLNAGQNIKVDTVEQQSRIAIGSYLKEQTTHAGSSIQAGNNVNLTAQSDISLQGAEVKSGKDLTLTSTNGNIDISAVKDRITEDHRESISDGWKRVRTDNETVIGTTLNGGSQVTVHAGALTGETPSPGGNINIEGSYIASDNGKVNLLADKAITIKEATEKHESLIETHQESSGFLSTTTTDTKDYSLINQVVGSTISGEAVDIHANNDITVRGSSVVGNNAVDLTAGKDIHLTSAAETGASEHYKMTKTSGIFSGGGFGITIGQQSEKLDVNERTLGQVGSTIGSVNDSVSINAGKQIASDGTTLVAQKDITVTGDNVSINNSVDTYDSQTKYEFKQSGINVSLGGGVVNTLTDTANHVERSNQVSDDRLKALYDYKAAKDIKKLGDQLEGGLNKNNLKKDVSVSISIGSSQSTSEQNVHTETANSSNITAGNNVNITAKTDDVTLADTKINAKNVTIDAARDINLTAAQNVEQTDSKSDSSSWSLGVSLNAGVFGNASKGSSNGNGTTITHSGTDITATDKVDLTSDRDTNMIGSQVKGKEIIADVGRDLNITSQQDIDNYAEKSSSSGIGFSTGPAGGVTGSASKGKINSDYSSVTRQAGIYAGEGGFDIKVGNNTDLKGAVISSEATPDKNKLSTDTLTYSDIENKADYSASSVGVNLDTRKNAEKKDAGLTPNIGVKVSGDADSTTQSAISPGTVEIRSNPNQDIFNLSRYPEGAVNALGKIFDKKTVQEKQELAKVFGEVAFDAIGTLADREREKATTPEEKAKWEEGGEYKVALHTLIGGIMSDLGGSNFVSGAVGAGASQAVQNELSKITNPALRQWASVLVGAVAAKVVGGNGQSGAGTAGNGIKYNDYGHKPTYEGAIIYTPQDGYCQLINGEYVKMDAPPPAGVYVWVEDPQNPGYGGDYKDNVYEKDRIIWQKFVIIDGKAYGITLKEPNSMDEKNQLIGLTKSYFSAVLISKDCEEGYNLINGSGDYKDYLTSILETYFPHLLGK